MNMKLDESYKPQKYEFTLDELKALKRIFFKHYIHYDDTEAMAVATRIIKLIDEVEKN